eukprot:TRINITY_DN2298_c0_g1_i4.p1 TRINITY_DN2298_c0_g1~~TRINITY_DN2298_c0_g1_i4.p1  ORF type:complete len:554 (+),score=153.31 TRINITY_DN2298_c0_g1_i4:610-2271(+)
MICFVIFCAEVIINSLVIDNYKFSLFFWLEIFAAISIIPDIPWIMEPIQKLVGITPTGHTADFRVGISNDRSQYGTYIYNAISSFKFFKLLRVVKLYRYFVGSSVAEDNKGEQQGNADTAQQAAMKKEMDPNRLGKILSDTNTRKILIEVILMYMVYPFLVTENNPNVFEQNMSTLFLAGSSNCYGYRKQNPFCRNKLLKSKGWEMLLKWYVDLGKIDDDYYHEVIVMEIPNYNNDGIIEPIKVVNDSLNNNQPYWYEHTNCAARIVSDQSECDLRISEMVLIKYTPEACTDGTISGCEDLTIYVRINTHKEAVKSALSNLLMIIFTTVLLFCSAILVWNDTSHIVVGPTARVIFTLRKLTDNPLLMPAREKKESDDLEVDAEPDTSALVLKTDTLEKCLYRIGDFLQMGYGKLGAQIIRENMLTGEGEINIMVPGAKIQAIFLICRINRFSELTDGLKDTVIQLTNKFAKIVHECGEFWSGQANKNMGEAFLLTWKLQSIDDHDTKAKKQSVDSEKTKIATKALVAAIKIFAEIKRANDIKEYVKHLGLKKM